MSVRDDYADSHRRARGPSLQALASVLVILMAISATVLFLTYFPPVPAGSNPGYIPVSREDQPQRSP